MCQEGKRDRPETTALLPTPGGDEKGLLVQDCLVQSGGKKETLGCASGR